MYKLYILYISLDYKRNYECIIYTFVSEIKNFVPIISIFNVRLIKLWDIKLKINVDVYVSNYLMKIFSNELSRISTYKSPTFKRI